MLHIEEISERESGAPASDEEIADFEYVCREIPEDYNWFLRTLRGHL